MSESYPLKINKQMKINPDCPGGTVTAKKVTYDGETYDDFICVGSFNLNPNFEGKSLCVIQNKATCKGDCAKRTQKDANGNEVDKYSCNVGCKYGMALQNTPPPPKSETIEYVDNSLKLKLSVTASTFFKNLEDFEMDYTKTPPVKTTKKRCEIKSCQILAKGCLT